LGRNRIPCRRDRNGRIDRLVLPTCCRYLMMVPEQVFMNQLRLEAAWKSELTMRPEVMMCYEVKRTDEKQTWATNRHL
jgi:hypothetical protein